MQAAVFLDRDGTIIEDTGYIKSPKEIKFIPGAIEAIKQLQLAGYKIIIISNQAGVARGYYSEDMLQTIDKTVHRLVLHGGAHIDASYYCPHHPEHGVYPYKQECDCRKPFPGLIKKAEKDLKLDLSRSFMVGDKTTDIEAGQKAGVKTVMVLTGRGKEEQNMVANKPNYLADDLEAAAAWILKEAKNG
ncbi:MAG: D-glycero-beta-D-manno-heptose 1,7-bisphosphate 7-phosphatase [bacterium]